MYLILAPPSPILIPDCTQHDNGLTPKIPSNFEPRYVGDIKEEHLSNPKQATRCLALALKTIDKQKRKIRLLQQQNRKLVNRVKKLKQLLRQHNVICGNCCKEYRKES